MMTTSGSPDLSKRWELQLANAAIRVEALNPTRIYFQVFFFMLHVQRIISDGWSVRKLANKILSA
jgi:hypothetical protein